MLKCHFAAWRKEEYSLLEDTTKEIFYETCIAAASAHDLFTNAHGGVRKHKNFGQLPTALANAADTERKAVEALKNASRGR